MDTVLEARDLSFRVDGKEIFRGLNFQIRPSEVCVILGASGSGKSVLLRLFSGLLLPDQGAVEVEGVNLAGASKETLQAIRAKMGFVFQDAALISNMSVYDNVALPLRYHTKLSEREVQSRVAEKMALFEVDRKSDRLIPAQVSLGMRKRVALARALVLDPALIFLDEPVMGLGTDADRLIAGVLKGYQQEARASLLMMASEWSPAFTIADRIGFLDSGRIAAEATVQEMQAALKEMQRPASPFVSLPEK